MNKKIIVEIPFNRRGERYDHNELNPEWLKYRLKIFKKYTLKSLENQTNQFFTTLLEVRDTTLAFIIEHLKDRIPKNVIVVANNYKVTVRRLIENYDVVYFTRLDSDDCFEKNYIDLLHNYYPKKETEILISQYCYNYDINTKRLMKFFLDSPQDYCKGKKYKLPGGHNGAITLKHELLKGYNYMDTVHDKNISSRFWEKSKGRLKLHGEVIEVTEKKKILQDFGVNL